MKHAPEPWKFLVEGDDDFITRTIVSSINTPRNLNEVALLTTGSFSDDVENANGERIVECVNALAGVENPKEFINKSKERIKELEEALKSTHKLNLHLYEEGTIGYIVRKQIEEALKSKA